MFRVNYMNVTIWVLGGVLFLFFIFFLIKRVSSEKSKKDKMNKNDIYIDSEIKNIFNEFQSIHNYDMAVNVLFKNRFSKSKYSTIPILISKNNGETFLISNPIKNLKEKNFTIIHKSIYRKIKKNELIVYDHSRYNNILKFLASINCSARIIIPYVGKKPIDLKNVIPIENLGEFINSQNYDNNNDIKKVYQKLKSVNMYKSKKLEVQ